MSISLRTWILHTGINCLPWHKWKGEIKNLPVSSQTLFRKGGLGIDILERECAECGYLFPDEVLLEVLKDPANLTRRRGFVEKEEDPTFGLLPDYFTEEDFEEEL